MNSNRLTVILLLINGATFLANDYLLARNLKDWRLNVRIAAMNREVTEQLPPHPCGAVILPGERCAMTTTLPPR